MSDLAYDKDRALWIPNRRSFLFLFGSAVAGAVLGVKPAEIVNRVTVELHPRKRRVVAGDVFFKPETRERLFVTEVHNGRPIFDLSCCPSGDTDLDYERSEHYILVGCRRDQAVVSGDSSWLTASWPEAGYVAYGREQLAEAGSRA